eukprot:GFUD01001804.1.p1 GENE.GFUD01001804.1~~GFUD01001804.1.p1  ORF type:complete len:876 (+),score=235.22 GFUD01001804.1:615-3242(+)
MPGIDVRMMSYGDRGPVQDRYNSEESLEDNQSTTSSTESRQSDFNKKEHEFIPTRSSGILASKPAANPAQFTRINSNPLLISAQKQMLLVEEVKKKKKEVKVGDDVPDWQSNLDGWKMRRRKQSEDAIVRVSEIKRIGDQEFENGTGKRKSSIGKKISLQLHNDDEIDFDELVPPSSEDNFQSKEFSTSANILTAHTVSDTADTPTIENTPQMASTPRSSLTNGSRRESRGISQEKVILEESEEEEEYDDDEEEYIPVNLTKNVSNSPYDSAIEGYRSFAKSQLNSQEQSQQIESSESVITRSESQTITSLSKETSVSRSASTSSLSFSTSSPGPSSLTKVQDPDKSTESKHDDEWEEKIETFVQPTRRVSTEISDKMKQKLASFEESNSSKETTPVRNIKPDNKFKDKLNAFKTIETAVNEPPPPKPRRESEPNLQTKPKGMPAYRSSSSSFMNTLQNNKFFQQNSLGSENDEDSLSQDNQLLDDALEESFNVLEDNKEELKENVVFSADDFLPMTGKMAPPQEKPPPLPANPPPDLVDRKSSEENELDKQEREIIESLEREEKEHKKYLESISSGSEEITTSIKTNNSSFSSDTHQFNSTVSHQTQSTQSQQTVINKAWPPQSSKGVSPPVNGDAPKFNKTSQLQTRNIGASTAPASSPEKQLREEPLDSTDPPSLHPKKKEKSEVKDYSKHWLIQEAEQRRISEAKQKQNLNIQHGQMEKIENINNNNVPDYQNSYGEKRVHNISDNIYANVDPTNLNYNKNHSTPYVPEPTGSIPQIPGPQVPPRLGDGQDRVLSVSGKKKCSHCKDELGRGAAMIIESLRLFYHIRCFKCCVCSIQLGNGETGTDVRVRNNRLHCQNCYSNDEGLKFSKV